VNFIDCFNRVACSVFGHKFSFDRADYMYSLLECDRCKIKWMTTELPSLSFQVQGRPLSDFCDTELFAEISESRPALKESFARGYVKGVVDNVITFHDHIPQELSDRILQEIGEDSIIEYIEEGE
jgi:hypothetical protein